MAAAVITIWSDIGCPWAHVAVHRLHRARRELDLESDVGFDHRPFPLELMNSRPTPWPTLSAEVAVLRDVEPDAGWQAWAAPAWQWPVTTLPALEAVQTARRQDTGAAERLDLALRRAFFADSRCIALRHEILGVAERCDLDVGALALAIDEGVARRDVIESWQTAQRDDSEVRGSPHVFLPDGTNAHNPGMRMHWPGEEGEGEPVVDADDPSVYRGLVSRAAGRG